MAGSSPWVVYTGTAQILLIIVLVLAAAAVTYAGFRLPLPVRPPVLHRSVIIIMIAAWIAAIVALLVCVTAYEVQAYRAGLVPARRPDPITPVTLTGVMVLFIVIAIVTRSRGWPVALGSAAIGALSDPWIFEVPFDLIILPRSHPALNPGLYRALLFGPLILTGVTTVALLSLSPVVRLRRATLWCFAATIAAFAAWGVLGFGYPSAPGPITLNTLSKILGLLTALTLFLPERSRSSGKTGPRDNDAGIPHHASLR